MAGGRLTEEPQEGACAVVAFFELHGAPAPGPRVPVSAGPVPLPRSAIDGFNVLNPSVRRSDGCRFPTKCAPGHRSDGGGCRRANPPWITQPRTGTAR